MSSQHTTHREASMVHTPDESAGEYDMTYWTQADADVAVAVPDHPPMEVHTIDVVCGVAAVVLLPVIGWLWVVVALGLALQ
jgi:hypothetical protein